MGQKRKRRSVVEKYDGPSKRRKEDNYYGLSLEVSRACDAFLESRGITTDPGPWDKCDSWDKKEPKLDFQLED